MKRRNFIKTSVVAGSAVCIMPLSCTLKDKNEFTFVVAADTHFDRPPETDQFRHVEAINNIAGNLKWEKTLAGKDTAFEKAGNFIDSPEGVVIVGDLIDRAEPEALELFKKRYEKGNNEKQINYPVYLGLGNHDINPEVANNDEKIKRRQMMWNYIDKRHKGTNAPIPVTNFDSASRNYSWNMGNVHFIMGQLFPGDTSWGQKNSLQWLADDLKKYASDGRPVILLQHYGFDEWALKWWTTEERKNLFKIFEPYNIAAIFVGHTHESINLEWNNIPVFEINNAWSDSSGPASFAVVRISNSTLEMITCCWNNKTGEPYMTAPFRKINIYRNL